MHLAHGPLLWQLLYAYQVAVLCAAGVLALIAAINLFAFRRPRAALLPDQELPLISILVPARNEEEHIEACVRSLLAQNYPRFEVVVLDDSSEDATYDILCRLRDQDHRLRVLIGAALPEDWCGKPYACWQLAQAAKGDYLLFTDADCRFSPDMLMLAVGAQVEHSADVVSLMPDYICVSFSERLLLPLLAYIPLTFLPMTLVRGTNHPWFAGANGSFLFMTREVYFAIDGHRAVKDQLSEDIKFAQHVKRSGRTLWYGDGRHAYSVRMYTQLAQIWEGFTRSLFPAFSKNLPLISVTLLLVAAVYVFPVLFAFAGLAFNQNWAWLSLAIYVVIVGIRVMLALRLEWPRDLAYAWLDPVAWAMTVAMAINSIRRSRGSGATWKGRVYTSHTTSPDGKKRAGRS